MCFNKVLALYFRDGPCQPLASDAAGNLQSDLANDIDPNDVLFVIGEDSGATTDFGKKALNPCTESPCELEMDLDKYRIVQGKLVGSPDILNMCANVDCCELKVSFNTNSFSSVVMSSES